MARIIELQNRINELEASVAKLTADGDSEGAFKESGALAEARRNYMDEVALVEAENKALKAKAAKDAEKAVKSILGARDQFHGIEPGWQTVVNAVSGLSTPQEYDNDLHEFIAPPMGVRDTLPTGICNGDVHFFQQPALTNAAAGWTSGSKAESSMEWTPAVAHLEVIAHQTPIARQTANRYDELDGAIRGALALGLAITKDASAVRGSNSNGIVGLANTSGIISHTYDSTTGVTLRDNILQMKRKARVASGFAPNYVALSPLAIESLMTAKDQIGNYLFPDFEGAGDTIVGLRVVEDVNMTHTVSNADKESALVYFSGAAEWLTADADEITVGLIDKQFIQNQYTLLAEGTYALKVWAPKAIAYCADLGL